ncbi:hypothetical protein BDZ90DRAFT_233670 [Jaminaea rosea]|uniref:Uncharacterized protein n=1 Tax=Jaminaea rosea TaxID=1569628 RepID=A0A316UMA3_9BASI|nr:hypothetical protein BDZ90DRAFT_233670 [Jaminaea rosea]PWN26084.1 hypothetical protein BDZ90DRAFT_233670 [Jaminaea rosea]
MSGWVPVIAGGAVGGISFFSWGAVRKGENQVLIRSCIILTLVCCYLMWAIMYLAQLHPVIKPKRGDLRLEE